MHRKYLAALGIVGSLVLTALLAACTWEEVQIKMQFVPEVGETYHIQMAMDQVITQTVQDQEMVVTQTMIFDYDITATEKDDAGTWMTIKYDRIQVKQEGSGSKTDYDTDNPPEEIPAVAMAYQALIGKGFSIKSTPTGEIIEIKGASEMFNAMIEDLGIEDEQILDQLKENLEEQYGDDALKQQMGNMLVQFPTGAVKIGDTWTSLAASGGIVPLNLTNTYVLEAYQDNIATIRVSSQITSSPDAKPTDMGFYRMEYALTGAQNGLMTVDISTGWTLGSTVTQTVTGTVSMTSGEQSIDIPMALQSIVRLTINKE